MSNKFIKKRAAEILSCQADCLEEKEIPEQNAIYFRNTNRGGGAIIVSNDGAMLFADPFFVDYNAHLQKFINGERSNFE